MAAKIKSSSLLSASTLEVNSAGVIFRESSGFSSVRRFSFGQIDLILMSPANILSFQVGREVFSIQTKPGDKTHQQIIDNLLQEVGRSA
jgi:hypothetical protein